MKKGNKMLTGIKGILFDLDNTLIDRQAAAEGKLRNMVDTYLPELKNDPMEREHAVQQLINWDEYGSVSKKHVFGNFIKAHGLSEDLQEVMEEDWKVTFGDYTVPFKESAHVLETLGKKYKVGIVTNGPSIMQRKKLDICNFYDLLDTVIVSGEFGVHKPDPSIFLEGARQLGLKPEEVAFVGDTFGTDIIGAYRAGLKPVWIFSDERRTAQAEVVRIHKIEDLLEIL